MFVLYLVICCIAKCYGLNGRIVECVIGRNTSLSFTSNNINKDAIVIFHNSLPFLRVLSMKTEFFLHRQDERLHIRINRLTYNTVKVTINITNVKKTDAGIYKMERNLNPGEVIDSLFVQAFDAAELPRITLVPHKISEPNIQLQCDTSTASSEKVLWKLNGSVIESNSKYSQNGVLIVIRNVTSDEKYNVYTCKEFETGPESDMFILNIFGPNAIKFAANVTVAKEYEWLNISCLTDCYPVCVWNWYRRHISSALKKIISTGYELQLKNITREDAGGYLCKVFNIISDTSLEGVTYLDVVYGPDEIHIDKSDTTIQLDLFDNISIFCNADCFPPCQISWTDTSRNIVRLGSELKLSHVVHDVNYTCQVTNPRISKYILSETIYIKVISGRNIYSTTNMIPENSVKDFPYTRHILYIAVGVGIMLSVGLFVCLLHKVRACSHVSRASNSTPISNSNQDRRLNTLKDESSSGHYWIIESNEGGESSPAPEAHMMQSDILTLKVQTEVVKDNALKHSTSVIDVNVDIELDEYMDPIHSGALEHNDYIHPVHNDYIHPVNTDFSQRDDAA